MDTRHPILAMLPLDYVEFFVFLAVLCVVGFAVGPGRAWLDSADYFLAGRKLPWYAVGGSYVAANVSTEHFIGLVGASATLMGMPHGPGPMADDAGRSHHRFSVRAVFHSGAMS